jgi:PAS domain S-box-containing protein
MGGPLSFKTLFDAAPNAYMVVDRELRYLAVNPAYLAATMRRRDELIGKRVTDVFPHDPDDPDNVPLQRLRASLTRVFETGQTDVIPFIHYRIRAGGDGAVAYEDRYWSATHVPVAGPSGDVEMVLQCTVDVTELHRRKQALDAAGQAPRGAQMAADLLDRAEAVQRQNVEARIASELKDQFLAIVSHELRTPLMAMLGWLSLLRAGKVAPEKQARALEAVERSARVQAQLVDDLLDVSRIISGKLDIERAPVELEAVISAAADTVRATADTKGVDLQVNAASVGRLDGDARRLQQVVWNLLTNAVKFTPAGGQVTLTARREADRVILTVTDTGVGIPPTFLPHVFERFQQAESSGARKLGGLGLGLSIVHHVVKAHGGEVTAASEGEGRGATFTVTLPAAAPIAAGAEGP